MQRIKFLDVTTYHFAVTSCDLSIQFCITNEAMRACYIYLHKHASNPVGNGMKMVRTLQENNCLIYVVQFCIKSTIQICTFIDNNQSLSLGG